MKKLFLALTALALLAFPSHAQCEDVAEPPSLAIRSCTGSLRKRLASLAMART